MWDFRLFDPASFRAPTRKVTRVFLHCTDSDNEALAGVGLAEEVNRWHLANGWTGIGYHFVVDKTGQAVTARPLELTPAAQLGEVPLVAPAMVHMGNVATIAISTHGSKMFPPAALAGTHALMMAIDAAYKAAGSAVTFHGHCEIDPRPCPVYPYKTVHGLDADGRLSGVAPLIEHPTVNVPVASQPPGAWPHLPIIEPHPEPVGARMLVQGCHGDDVRALQQRLTDQGFDTKGVDSWFGTNTLAAVIAFQTASGINPANGIVSDDTKVALGL